MRWGREMESIGLLGLRSQDLALEWGVGCRMDRSEGTLAIELRFGQGLGNLVRNTNTLASQPLEHLQQAYIAASIYWE